MSPAPTAQIHAPSRASRPGFTILEITVSLAALLIISLGLVAILSAVGKTVTGGRKASRLNAAAQLIENAIRRDVSQISPQGFLVIRQQLVDNPVPLSADDVTARARRIDEVLFFRNGTFASKRTPLNPDAAPVTGRTARIYLGHGQRRPEDLTANSLYLRPLPSDRMLDPNMGLGEQASSNPNRYASSWNLLRHVLVLAKPRDVESNSYSPTPIFDVDPATTTGRTRMADSRFQVGLQPAAPSIFRSVNFTLPEPDAADVMFDSMINQSPAMSSGLVDIAATDLLEIRSMVYGYAQRDQTSGQVLPADLIDNDFPPLPATSYFANPFTPGEPVRRTRPTQPDPIDVIHNWMDNAFPAESDPTVAAPYLAQGERPGSRMRAESSTINLLSIIQNDATQAADQRNQSADIVDQRMLQSSNLLVGCTEFIVDWSFGEYDSRGRLKWYGLARGAGDTNGDGTIDGLDLVISRPYGTFDPLDPPLTSDRTEKLFKVPVPVTDPDADKDDDGDIDRNDDQDRTFRSYQHPVTPRLIYGVDPFDDGTDTVLTSHFGEIDPTYTFDSAVDAMRQTPRNSAPNQDGAGNRADNIPTKDQLPWAWPKMLRFTISITDPEVPNYESTFQFVVTIPPREDSPAN
ncbi:MAG: type IV pilus modification PilV family protein [Phycisphaerales bacterium]